MKALKRMSYLDRGKLLADLFPEELSKLTGYIKRKCQLFKDNESQIRERWKITLYTADFWFNHVTAIDEAIWDNGNTLHTSRRRFAYQLFDGYTALVTMYCLIDYAEGEDCDIDLKETIHLLFGRDKIFDIPVNE